MCVDGVCREELEKKIKISRTKLEETRERNGSRDEANAAAARYKALKVAEHRLDVVVGRLNQIVRPPRRVAAQPLDWAFGSVQRDVGARARLCLRARSHTPRTVAARA
ncbi:hypothetical protein EON68_03405, partial [archaeon]